MSNPDKWIIVKIKDGDISLYKVLAGWNGGYTGADSWKMNSGISKIEYEDNFFKFYGYSGSCYKCHENRYGMTSMSARIYDTLIENAKNLNKEISGMPKDTDWLKLLEENE